MDLIAGKNKVQEKPISSKATTVKEDFLQSLPDTGRRLANIEMEEVVRKKMIAALIKRNTKSITVMKDKPVNKKNRILKEKHIEDKRN